MSSQYADTRPGRTTGPTSRSTPGTAPRRPARPTRSPAQHPRNDRHAQLGDPASIHATTPVPVVTFSQCHAFSVLWKLGYDPDSATPRTHDRRVSPALAGDEAPGSTVGHQLSHAPLPGGLPLGGEHPVDRDRAIGRRGDLPEGGRGRGGCELRGVHRWRRESPSIRWGTASIHPSTGPRDGVGPGQPLVLDMLLVQSHPQLRLGVVVRGQSVVELLRGGE